MRNHRWYASVVLPVLVCVGCAVLGSGSAPDVVGVWKGVDPDGNDLIMEFKPDRTLMVTLRGDQQYVFSGRYRLDRSVRPMALDVTDFDYDQLRGSTYLGIIEFMKDGSMMMRGTFAGPGEKGRRPTSFSSDIVVLKRSAK